MPEFLGLPFGTVFQAGTLAVAVASFFTAVGIWIRYGPDRKRAANEEKIIDNESIAARLKEFRVEVHGLRNELQAIQGQLHTAQNQSARRGDKLNMLLFILKMVMDELSARDPDNMVLRQARSLLARVEEEPEPQGRSNALKAAEETVEAARTAVNEVKRSESEDSEA